MPIFEIETDQGIFEIDADREPTQAEALRAISAQAQASTLSPARQASVQQGRAEEQAARQAIIRDAQRGGLEKAISGTLGLGKALVSPFVSIAKGFGATPEVVADPSRILPTVGETSRRTGMDIVNITEALGDLVRPKSVTEGLFGPAGGVLGSIVRGVGNLRSYTPTEEEIVAELAKQPIQQAIGEERQKIRFEGAEPTVSEGAAQLAQVISPIKGVQALKAGGKGLAAVPRNIRAAIKPRNAQVGSRVEKAAADEFSDIFHAEPNADTLLGMPIEGFQQTVSTLRQSVGKEIGELAAQQKLPINAGDTIAQRLTREADAMEAAGGAADNVAFLRQRAQEMAGRAVDIDSTQRAVTNANQELTPLYQRGIAAQSPGLANVTNIANKIIAEEGGAAINRVLESIGGERGAGLRKKWSNLTTLEREAAERANKLINAAPVEVQSVVQQTLTSVEGAVGLVGLVNGFSSGAIPLVTSAAKSWAKKASREMKDSNALIKKSYDAARKNPPKRVPRIGAEAPPIPQISPEAPLPGGLSPQELLNQQIQQQLSGNVSRGAVPESANMLAMVEQEVAKQALNEQIARQILGQSQPPPIPGTPTQFSAGTVAQGVPPVTIPGFTPRPGVAGAPEMGAVAAARAQALAQQIAQQNAIRQAIEQSSLFSQSLSGTTVPRVFNPSSADATILAIQQQLEAARLAREAAIR